MMKALTISQPYADLIADGLKPVENRRRPTNYRGPLAIHAGKGTQYLTRAELASYRTGAVIATCELVMCVELAKGRASLDDRILYELEQLGWNTGDLMRVLQHKYTEGPWCWVLENVRRLSVKPIPAIGKQGIWNWEVK